MQQKYAEITELDIPWSELSRRKLSPTLATAHHSCPDNTIGLVAQCELSRYARLGQLMEAVGCKEYKNFTWKNMQYAHFAEICKRYGNIRNMRQSHKTDMPKRFNADLISTASFQSLMWERWTDVAISCICTETASFKRLRNINTCIMSLCMSHQFYSTC